MTPRRHRIRTIVEAAATLALGLAILLAVGAVVSLLRVEGGLRVLMWIYVVLGAFPVGRAILWAARRVGRSGNSGATDGRQPPAPMPDDPT